MNDNSSISKNISRIISVIVLLFGQGVTVEQAQHPIVSVFQIQVKPETDKQVSAVSQSFWINFRAFSLNSLTDLLQTLIKAEEIFTSSTTGVVAVAGT
ncbi:unnamed protein product [Paramecium sonneborni]|uniref:Uncharacterized protein n=1 Tax=Paramecium sonneborni TaxID=65129 RepID=A0A8S1PRA3_9CILI|nr:unnamed protein product [Paramecium sonneborni]